LHTTTARLRGSVVVPRLSIQALLDERASRHDNNDDVSRKLPIQTLSLTETISFRRRCVTFAPIETSDQSQTAVDRESNDETEIRNNRAHSYHDCIRHVRAVSILRVRRTPYTQ